MITALLVFVGAGLGFLVGYLLGDHSGTRTAADKLIPRLQRAKEDLAKQQDENDALFAAACALAKSLPRERWDDEQVQQALAILDKHRLCHPLSFERVLAEATARKLTPADEAAIAALGTPKEVAQRIAKQYREEHP